jgi:hypothetical protein
MNKVSQIISENTGISLGVLISLLGVIAWLTDLRAKASTTADHVMVIEAKQEKDEAAQQEIREWMIRIDGKMDSLIKRR